MSVNTPSNDPLSIIPTQKTPEVQSSPQTPEVKKEITENEVLNGFLEKYRVETTEFEKLRISGETQAFLQKLKDSLKAEKKDINLENLVDEAYQEYVKKKLKNTENQDNSEFSIEKVGESIGSNRLNKFNEVIDKYFDLKLEKYNFVDNSTKEFLKINIYNQLLENGFLNIINTQTGGTNKLFNDILNGSIKLDELIDQMKEEKKGEPKISIVGFDLLNNYLSPCLKKFDEIEAFFKENKIDDKKNQENIFSNIEFFRDPNNFSKIGEFNIKTIDPKLTTEFDGELNVEELSEMILKSKDLQEKLSDALAGGEKSENLIYKLSNNETTGKNTSKLMQMLFKIPLFGKMFAGLLGYDQNNPMLDYMQTSKGFGLYDSLTKLGKHKTVEEGKETYNNGTLALEGIEFQIDFQAEKALFKEVGKTFPELKDKDGYNNFWLKAFGKDGYKSNEEDSFRFEVDKENFKKMTETDKIIDTKEFGELIKDALKNYNDEKNKALNTKPEEENKTTSTTTPSNNTPELDEKTAGETTGVPATSQAKEEVENKSEPSQVKEENKSTSTNTVDSEEGTIANYNSLKNPNMDGYGYPVSGKVEIDPYSEKVFKEEKEYVSADSEITKKAIAFIMGNDREEVLKNNFTGVFGDLNQFLKTSVFSIINCNQDYEQLLIDKVGEGDSKKIDEKNKKILIEVLKIFDTYIHNHIVGFNNKYGNTNSDIYSRKNSISYFLNIDIDLISNSGTFKEFLTKNKLN